ncbi:centrosomal protein of 76 kDa isoform X2 [Nothobranchius furzeri]|uniref:centrosomal protein of 76 kDa isoform X2 n=1 Tax=Nothobranchius furzeri TaxID=105023 RepID=UPI003904AACF
MSLPSEKASELKQRIHNHLLKMDIHGKIRELIAETLGEDQGSGHRSLSEADVLRVLQRRGIIDDVMKDLHFTQAPLHHTDVVQGTAPDAGLKPPPKPTTHFGVFNPDVPLHMKTNVDPSRRYLHLQVLGGKAFLEHLQEPEPLPGQVCSTFKLYLHFHNQRFHSKPVPCACEPDLREGFLLEMHKDGLGDGSKMVDATDMLSICDPVHFVLIKTDTSGETTLVSSYFLDWRIVLSSPSGKTCFAVELMGVGSECKVPAGVLTVSLELYPPLSKHLNSDVISTQGDCEDHAALLCSLLLGFGLDAYMCVGTKAKGVSHAWVLTRGTDGTITFWESLTAHRYLHRAVDPDAPPLALQPKPSSPYRTVGCVFNHQSFLANCQPSDAVELCVFDFQNPSRWKAMSEEALKSVCAPASNTSLPPLPPLCAPSVDPAAASNQLELEMRYLVSEHRKDLDLATVWDDHLSYLLSSALSAYETERCTGVSCGNEEFQDAVRRAVPDGHTFKGFPIHFLHRNARRAFATCLRSPFCEEIVSCRGDHVRLAVRVRVFVYPENAFAVWLMFACKYRSVL